MHKIQKKFLIIFLLFFIFYLINKTFSLKFKEGNEEEICDESVNNKCKYYEKNKILCNKKKKSVCKSNYCKFDFYGIKPTNNNCEFSQCLRPYGNKKKGCVSDLDDQSNIYDANKNPCMNVDFCKNCKKCYDDDKNQDKIFLDDGTEFNCKKCLHNGRKKLHKIEKKQSDGFKSYFPWFFCNKYIGSLDCYLNTDSS